MLRIIQAPPDPRRQNILDYVSRLQEERFRAEQARAQERTFDFAGFLGGGLVGAFPTRGEVKDQGGLTRFGAGVGKMLPFAGAALGGSMGGPAGAAFGAEIGGQIGQVFAPGDVARQDIAGFTSAAKAAGGLMQAMEDQQLYGYSPTKQERAAYTQALLKAGVNVSQSRAIAFSGGPMIPEQAQIAQVEQASVEQLDRLARDFNMGLTGAELKEKGESYPGGTHQLIQDWREQEAEFNAQTAAEKSYQRQLATLNAQQDYFAGLAGNMKRKANPREVNEVDQRKADVEDALRRGDMNLQQAVQELDRIIADTPRVSYSPSEPTVEEDWGKDFAIVQRPMPDGTMSRPFMVRRGRRTPENTTGERHFEGWIGAKGKGMDLDFGTYYRSLSPTQRQNAYRDTYNELFITRQKGQPDPDPPEVYKSMEAKYDIFGELYPAQPTAPAGMEQQGTQAMQGAALSPVERAAQAYGAISEMVSQKPVGRWSEQELEMGSQLIDKIILDIEQSGTNDPRVLAMLQQAIEFSDVIHAQRNR